MAISVPISASSAAASGVTPTDIFGAGTTINFGQGSISTPDTNNITATTSPTATATAAQGSIGSGGAASALPWIIAAALGSALLAVIFIKK